VKKKKTGEGQYFQTPVEKGQKCTRKPVGGGEGEITGALQRVAHFLAEVFANNNPHTGNTKGEGAKKGNNQKNIGTWSSTACP